MLPKGFTKTAQGHLKYYNTILGKLQDNIIIWSNERVRNFEYQMFKQQLEKSGYIVKWEI